MNENSGPFESILAEQDILPIGRFEAIPVRCRTLGRAEDYPDVVRLQTVKSLEILLEEAVRVLKRFSDNRYVGDRIAYMDKRIPFRDWRNYLADMGFSPDVYETFPIRKLGSNELEDFVLPATKNFLSNLGVEVFRQQYAVSQSGWKTKYHSDHGDFKTHGFRGMLPLNEPAFMGYKDHRGQHLIYRLEPGQLHFVNIVKQHRGFTFSGPRIALLFQMASDELLFQSGRALEPIADVSGMPV